MFGVSARSSRAESVPAVSAPASFGAVIFSSVDTADAVDAARGALPRAVADPADDSLRRQAHAAGYLAYGLMFATVVWGVMTTTGTVRRSVNRQTIYGAHMVLSIMAMCATALHAMSHLFTHTGAYTVMQLLVPFASPFKITLGVVSFEFMVVAATSVWLQRRLSYHRWHRLHRIGYPAYVLVIGHVMLSAHHLSDGAIVIAMAVTGAIVCALAATSVHPSTRIPVHETL